jgi:predicted regulator of Ras-like GTPase activity (Roadblock/LC7/MglB family)
MNDNQKLRVDRLVFYEEDIRDIEVVLKELLKLSNARCALLIDKEGHLVAKMGAVRTFDTDTISALVAGSFAATREMARILGEEEFSIMFHQGQRDNIQLNLVGERTILTVIFDEQTTVGMVRLYAAEASRKLTEVFEEIRVRTGKRVPGDQALMMADDYEASARQRLDSLFS